MIQSAMREQQTDEALVAAWRAGDEAAFAVVFHRYRDRVVGYAYKMVRRREEAEEVCLEAFCRVVEGRWKPTGSFRSFLFTVVHRLCIDRLRKRGRAEPDADRVAREASPGRSPEEHAMASERGDALERAVATLPEEHRAVLLLYYGQELPSKEVAEILGCDDHQVRSRPSYARKLLRRALDGDPS